MSKVSEFYEMMITFLPIGLLSLSVSLLVRIILINGNLFLVCLSIIMCFCSLSLSLYLGTRRVSREYGDVYKRYFR